MAGECARGRKRGTERPPLTVPVCVRVDCVRVSGARLAHGQVFVQHGAERHAAGGRGRPDEPARHVRAGGGELRGEARRGGGGLLLERGRIRGSGGAMILPLLLLLPLLLRPVCSVAGG